MRRSSGNRSFDSYDNEDACDVSMCSRGVDENFDKLAIM